MIFTHGNYNWFNALIVVLTLSLVDDRFVFNTDPSNQESNLARFFNRFVYTSMTVLVCYFFSPKIGGHQLIDWKISQFLLAHFRLIRLLTFFHFLFSRFHTRSIRPIFVCGHPGLNRCRNRFHGIPHRLPILFSGRTFQNVWIIFG